MAAWKRSGGLEKFERKLKDGTVVQERVNVIEVFESEAITKVLKELGAQGMDVKKFTAGEEPRYHLIDGSAAEEAPAAELFDRPSHPYTEGLLGSIPHLGDAGEGRSRLNEIKGLVPSLFNLPPGCAFAPRCAKASEHCRQEQPTLAEHRADHFIACWHPS